MSNLFTPSNYHISGTTKIEAIKVTESEVVLNIKQVCVCPCCGKVISTSSRTKSIPRAEYDVKMKRIHKWLDELNF